MAFLGRIDPQHADAPIKIVWRPIGRNLEGVTILQTRDGFERRSGISRRHARRNDLASVPTAREQHDRTSKKEKFLHQQRCTTQV
jgi:hypothetical protein